MSSERPLLAALGALHGLALWLLANQWPETWAPSARAAAATFVCVLGLVVHFAWTGADRARLLALALGVGALYAAISWWIGWQIPGPGAPFHGDEARWGSWMLCGGLSLFALGPFLQIYERTGALRFPYTELFSNAWGNLFVAALAGVFLGALWAVLSLWGALFRLVGIEWFSELFRQPVFAWVTSGAVTALGVRLARENARVIETLRRVTLVSHQVLLPLVSFVAVLFLGSLAVTGLGPLWKQEYASGLVLGWMALHMVFLNAAFQDGTEPPPASRALRALASAGVLTLPAYGAISVWGLALRIGQRGLSPARFWGVLLACIALGLGVAYAASLLRRGRGWLHTLPAANRVLALALVALAFATHTPLLDPLRWSARDQLRRIVSGCVPPGEFDFGFLRFELGRAGESALVQLDQIAAHPQRAALREGVAQARAAQSYEDWRQGYGDLRAEDLFVRAADGMLPPALLGTIRAQMPSYQWQRCRSSKECVAVAVELDTEPGAEWIVKLGDGSTFYTGVFSQVAGTWTRVGELGGPEADLDAALREGRIESVAPRWQDVLIAGERHHVDRR